MHCAIMCFKTIRWIGKKKEWQKNRNKICGAFAFNQVSSKFHPFTRKVNCKMGQIHETCKNSDNSFLANQYNLC